MRKRTIAQLYPYSIELASYKIQVRSHGIRPTKLVDVNDNVQEDPTVRFEIESHARLQQQHKKHSLGSNSHNNQNNKSNAHPGLSVVNLHKRVIRDSEDENSDLEQHFGRRNASQHQQHIYFSESEEDDDNNEIHESGLQQLSDDQVSQKSGDWDPFGSDSDASTSSSITKFRHKKGVLPASYIPDDRTVDLSQSSVLTPLNPTSSTTASISHQRGVAIHKKGKRHEIQREIPDTSEVIEIRKLSHYRHKKPKQSDIREFHEDDGYGGAVEYDVVDHMLTRGGGSRKNSRISRAKPLSSKGWTHSKKPVAISRNPRRIINHGRNNRQYSTSTNFSAQSLSRIPKKSRKPSQTLPAQRFHSTIVQKFIGNFQHGPSTTKNLNQVEEEHNDWPLKSKELQNLKKTKRRGPRPLAVVSGLHIPRNKPNIYSSVFQVESGRYAPRGHKKYRLQKIPEYPYEFPSSVFREQNQPMVEKYFGNNNESAQNQNVFKKTSESISKVLDFLETSIPNENNLSEMENPIDDIPSTENNNQLSPIELLSPVRSNANDQSKPKPLLTLNGSLERENYTQNFNVFPLQSSVWFEEDSFVGQGIFSAIMKSELIDDEQIMDHDLMQWSGYFGPEIGKIDWTSHERTTVTLSVVQKVKSVFELMSDTWFSEKTEVTSEQTDAAYYFLKFVCDYFFQTTNTVIATTEGSNDYEDELFDITNKTLGSILVSIKNQGSSVNKQRKELELVTITFLSCFFYIPFFRRRRNLEPENLQIAFAFLAKKLLANFNEISNQVKELEIRVNQNRLIVPRKPLFLIEICYVCVHLIDNSATALDDSDAGTSFLLEIQKCVNATTTPTLSNLERNEIMWNAIFQFNTFYQITGPTEKAHERMLPRDGWKVVNSLVIPLFESLRRTSGTGIAHYAPETEVTLSQIDYLKAILARCLNLILTWKWLPDREILKSIYACFASIRYANLEPNDVGHHIAKFLKFNRNLKYEQWSRPAVHNDTLFELFLKYLAVTIKTFKQGSNPRQHQRLIDLVNVLNAFKYPPRDSEIQVAELESLANQYNLLLARYKFSSKTCQPPIEQLVGLFPLDNSHLLARQLSVEAWSVVCEIQLARNQSLKQTMSWYDQLVAKALDEYIQVDKLTPKQRLDNNEIQRTDRRMIAYEHYLFCPLKAVLQILSGENRKNLLVKSTQWGLLVRKIFLKMLIAPEVKKTLKFEVLRILEAYLESAIYMQSVVREVPDDMVDNEDSQALMFVVPDDRKSYIDLLGRRYSSVIQFSSFKEFLNSLLGDEAGNSQKLFSLHSLIIKAIDTWVLTAQFLVPAGFGDWRMYYYSWQWFQKSDNRMKYESYWLSKIVRLLSTEYYEEERVKILQDLVRYLVCVNPSYEHEYVKTVFAREKELFQTTYIAQTVMMINTTTFGMHDFGRERSVLVQNIVRELGKIMEISLSSRDAAKSILVTLATALKTNCKAVNFKNENGYMEFVRQIVDWIIQYCQDIDVVWFMESSPFTAAIGHSELVDSNNSLRETRYKITKFKRMLQIDFSNEYMAGYKILYYFCLELQASVFNQNTCFTEIVSTTLRPDRGSTKDEPSSRDPYRTARRFLVSAFIVPYILEATVNRAVRIFLDPLLDTVVKIFESQRVNTCVIDEELYLEVLKVLESYLWINLNSGNSNSFSQDYWFWKCVTTFFRLLEFAKLKEDSQHVVKLALYTVIFGLSEAPHRLVDVAAPYLMLLKPVLTEKATESERRRVAARTRKPFYQPIAATFFGHVSYNYHNNQFYAAATTTNAGSNPSYAIGGSGSNNANSGNLQKLTLIKFAGSWRAERDEAAERIYGFLLRSVSALDLEMVIAQTPGLTNALRTVCEDQRSRFAQLRFVLESYISSYNGETLLDQILGKKLYCSVTICDDFMI